MTVTIVGNLASQTSRGGSRQTQRVRAEVTRAALISAARLLFADAGFFATGTHEIVACAAVTRGALYHHFSDKNGLFEAVFAASLAELHIAARDTVRAMNGETWAQFIGAVRAYLACLTAEPAYRQILLIDGPAVLGWQRWRELQVGWIETGLIDTLIRLMAEGVIADCAPAPLAIVIEGALNEAALSIAYAVDPATTNLALSEALETFLNGLKR